MSTKDVIIKTTQNWNILDEGFIKNHRCDKVKKEYESIPKGIAFIKKLMAKRCLPDPKNPAKTQRCKDFHNKMIQKTKDITPKNRAKWKKLGC